MSDRRAEFERQFPLPDGVIWCGNGYASTDWGVGDGYKNAYDYMWRAWRAARSQGAEPVGVIAHTSDCRGDDPKAFVKWLFGGDEINLPNGTELYINPPASQQVTEWVKCSDRPPLMYECVDVWATVVGGHHNGDESRISNCFFDHESERWWKWDCKCEDRVYLCGFFISHWMPLPQPPQEGE